MLMEVIRRYQGRGAARRGCKFIRSAGLKDAEAQQMQAEDVE